MTYLFLVLKGMVVGGANVMPGVSGATLAVIFRIYDRLIASINELFSNMKESLKFLVPVGIGMVVGIIAAGGIVDFFLVRFSLQTGGFIAGLMAGSMPFIHRQSMQKIPEDAAMLKYYVIAVAAAAFIILLTIFAPDSGAAGETAGVFLGAGLIVQLFAGGAFAAAAMVIPGISGAMVLMLFGLYPLAMRTISNIREYLMSPADLELLMEIVIVVAPLGVGIVAGILLGSKLIAWFLAKYHSATYFAIMGLVLGTVFVVFSNPDTYQSHDEITGALVVFTVIAFVVGMVTSLVLGKKEADSI
ncbi:MAG: DUF368 domain-containing protein [Defluviitaleaceae bacterium]|nr:DUF368 domain-containing protein [Defluviitaleaceae bacterium]